MVENHLVFCIPNSQKAFKNFILHPDEPTRVCMQVRSQAYPCMSEAFQTQTLQKQQQTTTGSAKRR